MYGWGIPWQEELYYRVTVLGMLRFTELGITELVSLPILYYARNKVQLWLYQKKRSFNKDHIWLLLHDNN